MRWHGAAPIAGGAGGLSLAAMTRARTPFRRSTRGFAHAAALLAPDMRAAAEKRGFALARMLTHWTEIVGEDTARLARPVKMTYGRGSLGGTLVVLVPGAAAPMVQMQAERIRRAVNAAYGYAAVARVRLTQTAPEGHLGFAEAAPPLDGTPPGTPDPARAEAAARDAAAGAADPGLRAALEALGREVLSSTTQGATAQGAKETRT